MPTYTEEEVQVLLKAQEDRLEAVHFEKRTKEVLDEINKRLNESNNYKATIGKDVRNIIQRLEDLEAQRAEDKKSEAQAKENRQEQHKWYQDWWIRVGITSGVVYEILQILHVVGIIK